MRQEKSIDIIAGRLADGTASISPGGTLGDIGGVRYALARLGDLETRAHRSKKGPGRELAVAPGQSVVEGDTSGQSSFIVSVTAL